MIYLPGTNSRTLTADQHNNDRLKKIGENKINNELKELGKISAFKEEFEGIKLENQEFPQIPTIDNIVENEYFIEGRNFGFLLIENGFNEENYNSYNKTKETTKHR